jgi:hypothetical protein
MVSGSPAWAFTAITPPTAIHATHERAAAKARFIQFLNAVPAIFIPVKSRRYTVALIKQRIR